MSLPIPYEGNEPYIFISYSHRDSARVLPIVDHLINSGYRVWYDQGIEPGTEWDEMIAAHVENCSCFVAFLSENYLGSNNCKDELNFARDLEKERLTIYLDPVTLSRGMAMRINRLQAVFRYQYTSDADFYQKLFSSTSLIPCRADAKPMPAPTPVPAPVPEPTPAPAPTPVPAPAPLTSEAVRSSKLLSLCLAAAAFGSLFLAAFLIYDSLEGPLYLRGFPLFFLLGMCGIGSFSALSYSDRALIRTASTIALILVAISYTLSFVFLDNPFSLDFIGNPGAVFFGLVVFVPLTVAVVRRLRSKKK